MKIIKYLSWSTFIAIVVLAAATYACLEPIADFSSIIGTMPNTQVTDRHGTSLSVTYQNKWNVSDYTPLHNIPQTLKSYFILSEDKNFYVHQGVDWRARAAALWQNLRSGRVVRGASTIDEQVVRMIHPRKRNLWAKWLEGFEAYSLNKHANKTEILEFYLNQLPYGANRRGVSQAARYYFDRDLSTLNRKEMIALVILARAPSDYDLYKNPGLAKKNIQAFLSRLNLTLEEKKNLEEERFSLANASLPVNASHFVRHIRKNADHLRLETTLDATLQVKSQDLLDRRLESLSDKNVSNGAVLVVDHTTNEILAWVIGGALNSNTPGNAIDAVTVPRQPGSSMKPFLYAAALDKGWTAATVIDDSPLSEAVGNGLHRFRNYSRHFYGPLPLRETLGNSLNIPALKTIRFVGVGNYLSLLHQAGFSTLDQTSGIYDEGLALGNAEVTLYDLVQAYTALANYGLYRPLRFVRNENSASSPKRLFSSEAASLIGNILSDPYARRLEFGTNSVLNLPVQTAVKTGTSNDYNDAWAIGYNDKYVVGVWMGNLNRAPMNGVTGSTGSALVMRSVFAELNKYRETKPLYLSPRLQKYSVCAPGSRGCYEHTEYFMPDTAPSSLSASANRNLVPELIRPTDQLQIAYDPRIPADKQKFRFEVSRLNNHETVEWIVNGQSLATTKEKKYLWPLKRGKYTLSTIIHTTSGDKALPPASFRVK